MNRVRERREALGISRESLAAAAALSCGMLWRIETGRSQPTVPVAHRIAAALESPFVDLFPPDPAEIAEPMVAPGSAA